MICVCSESFDKSDEVAALEATALLGSLGQSLYVRCPAISGQLPPAQPCPARGTFADASSTGERVTTALALQAVSGGGAHTAPAGQLTRRSGFHSWICQSVFQEFAGRP